MEKQLHRNYFLWAKLLIGVCTIFFLQKTVLGNELKAEQKQKINAVADSEPTTLVGELKPIASKAHNESDVSSFSNLTPLPAGSKLLKAESQEELRVEAEIEKDEKAQDRSGWAIMPKVGTLGIGAEVFTSITDSFNLRAGFSRFQIGDEGILIATTTGQEGIRIDSNGELRIGSSFSLSGDFYPFNDWFFLTVGLSINDNSYSFSRAAVRLPNSEFVAPGVRGKVEFNRVAPTIGIGFGNPVRRGQFFGFFFNAGVMFQGAGKVSLEGGVGTDRELQIIKETLTIDELEIWPVAQVGISFQF